MRRKQNNQEFRNIFLGFSAACAFTVAFGLWNRPEVSVYDNWPVAGTGYLIEIRSVPGVQPLVPQRTANESETPSTESVKPEIAFVVDVAEIESVDQPVLDSQEALRLPDTDSEAIPELPQPGTQIASTSTFPEHVENPYLVTD